jgi:hypothetical protein
VHTMDAPPAETYFCVACVGRIHLLRHISLTTSVRLRLTLAARSGFDGGRVEEHLQHNVPSLNSEWGFSRQGKLGSRKIQRV